MNTLELFKKVSTFVFDIDGVLTDGSLLILQDGVMARRMNIKDGYAIQLAIKKGYKILVISGSNSSEVQSRLQKLGVTEVFMDIEDKKPFLEHYLHTYKLNVTETLYMGDDIPDLSSMKIVLLPCCPLDAVGEIRLVSKYISPEKGGLGCVRDVIEKVLKLNNHWEDNL